MGRRRLVVALVAATIVAGGVARSAAQNPAAPANPGASQRTAPQSRPAMREHWRQMSVEDRQRFKSNADRWMSMPPEQRRAMREREGLRRERIQREAQAAMRDSGLQLEAEKRAQFEQRYLEERRRIDRALREELKQKRQRELAPVVEQLKKEFGQPQGSPGTGAASTTPSPSK